MNELVITRMNHLIDPNLHIWGWEVPVYLFFGGLVAGIMIISGYFIVTNKHKEENSTLNFLPYLGLILISIGMGSLFLDLEHKLFTWRMYTAFMWKSPMSWGAWILMLVYPILLIVGFIKIPPMIGALIPGLDKISEKINKPNVLKSIGVLSIAVGALLGLYTGVLLSAFGARPAWNSAMLWILFLTSGLSAAAALIHMLAKNKDERELLAKSDNVLLMIEFVLILLYLVGLLTSSKASGDAAMLLINGQFAAIFWIFVVGLGIIVPLIIQLSAVTHKIKHTPVGPILVLFGGLMLRFIIVAVGQFSHWSKEVLK